jgi:hypothetical protein
VGDLVAVGAHWYVEVEFLQRFRDLQRAGRMGPYPHGFGGRRLHGARRAARNSSRPVLGAGPPSQPRDRVSQLAVATPASGRLRRYRVRPISAGARRAIPERWRHPSYHDDDSIWPEVACGDYIKGRFLRINDLIERIRRIIDHHSKHDREGGVGVACGCGAEGLSDHSRHVAEEIVDRLGLRPNSISNVSKEISYVSAWFANELTKLEGAE